MEEEIGSGSNDLDSLLERDVSTMSEEDFAEYIAVLLNLNAWEIPEQNFFKYKKALRLATKRADELEWANFAKELRDKMGQLVNREDSQKLIETTTVVIPEYSTDIELADLNAVVAEQGKEATKRHWLRTATHTVFQSVFAGFMTIARFGLVSPVKYVLSIASIPIEIINLVVNMAKLVSKQKPWYVIAGVVLGGLAAITILSLMDAVKWGGWQSGTLFTISTFGPFVFTAILGTFALLNIGRSIGEGLHLYRNPEHATRGKKFALIHQIVKTAGLSVLAGLIIPFMLILLPAAAAGNPIGATIVITVIVATLATMVAMKIAKTIRENRQWKKTIDELKSEKDVEKNDPYKRLGFTLKDQEELTNRLTAEAAKAGKHNETGFKGKIKSLVNGLTNFGQNLKAIWQNSPLSTVFAITAKQKENLAAARKINKENESKTAAAFIKEHYEAKMKEMVPSFKTFIECKEAITNQENEIIKKTQELSAAKKNRSQDVVVEGIKNELDLARQLLDNKKQELVKVRAEFRKDLRDNSEAQKLMDAYDLVKKARGRAKWQDANEPKEDVKPALVRRVSGEENDLDAALNPSAYRNPTSGSSPTLTKGRDKDPLLGKRIK